MKNIKNDEKLNTLNHSCAHLLAHAVKHLYPEAKFWVGPVIDEGFYYDIDLGDKVINDEDFTEQLHGYESDEYTSEQKDLEGYIFTKLDGESSGLMSVDVILDQAGNKVFDNVTTIVYYYKHIAGGVIERHIDEITGEVIEENRYEGKVQDPYVTTNKNFTGYDLVEDKLPENSTGEMT